MEKERFEFIGDHRRCGGESDRDRSRERDGDGVRRERGTSGHDSGDDDQRRYYAHAIVTAAAVVAAAAAAALGQSEPVKAAAAVQGQSC